MTPDDYIKMWNEENDIDISDINGEILRRQKIFTKYVSYHTKESMLLAKKQADLAKLIALKREWYNGKLDDDQLAKLGWEPRLKSMTLKEDIKIALEGDSDIVDEKLKIAFQRQKVDVLEKIIKEIDGRKYELRTLFEYRKFVSGG